jgi:lipopolysaccharide transport system permease protein
VVTSASNAVITLALFSVVLITFLYATGRRPSLGGVALYALYQLQFLAIVAGFSLAASVLFMRYRDLNQVWEVVTQAGFFVAPIIYPIDILPERVHAYLYAWPPTPIILFSRSVLLDGRVPSLLAHVLLTLEAAAILLLGASIYRARAPRVAEYL